MIFWEYASEGYFEVDITINKTYKNELINHLYDPLNKVLILFTEYEKDKEMIPNIQFYDATLGLLLCEKDIALDGRIGN